MHGELPKPHGKYGKHVQSERGVLGYQVNKRRPREKKEVAFKEGLCIGGKFFSGENRNFAKGIPGSINMKNMFFTFEGNFINFNFTVSNNIKTITVVAF